MLAIRRATIGAKRAAGMSMWDDDTTANSGDPSRHLRTLSTLCAIRLRCYPLIKVRRQMKLLPKNVFGPPQLWSGPQSQKIARTAPKNFLNNSRGLLVITHKIRVLRQIAPESSPESSAKSLSQKFFGVLFLSLIWCVLPPPRGLSTPCRFL